MILCLNQLYIEFNECNQSKHWDIRVPGVFIRNSINQSEKTVFNVQSASSTQYLVSSNKYPWLVLGMKHRFWGMNHTFLGMNDMILGMNFFSNDLWRYEYHVWRYEFSFNIQRYLRSDQNHNYSTQKPIIWETGTNFSLLHKMRNRYRFLIVIFHCDQIVELKFSQDFMSIQHINPSIWIIWINILNNIFVLVLIE